MTDALFVNNNPGVSPDAAGELKNLKIDPDLHRRLKIEAATRGVSLQALTEAALAVGLAAPELSQTLANALAPNTNEGTP